MSDTPTASGADLARQALAAARAAAKNRPAAGPKKTRSTTRPSRGEGRDPQAFGNVLEHLKSEQGWEASIDGGSIIDRWASICPTQLATTVQPVAYDPDRGLLTLQPSTPAYATQLRLFQQQLARHLNQAIGKPAVRAIRVLPPGGRHPGQPQTVDQPAAPAREAPVKTRETAHPGYREALEAALAHRPSKEPGNPYVLEAMRRQEAALRANRQPADEDREAYWASEPTGPQPGSVEASLAAALAYKRSQAAGRTPRRAFDVA